MGNFCLSSKRKPMRGQVGLAVGKKVPKTVFWTPSFNYNQKDYIQYKQYTYIRWMTFPFVSALPFPFLHVVNGSLGNQSVQVQRMYHQVNLLSSKWCQNVVMYHEVNLLSSKWCDVKMLWHTTRSIFIIQWHQNVVTTIHICFKLIIHICFTTRSIFSHQNGVTTIVLNYQTSILASSFWGLIYLIVT